MSTGFIFDVDGTILDSMGIWMNVGELYLKDMGIKAEPNLGEILFEMTSLREQNPNDNSNVNRQTNDRSSFQKTAHR